MVTWKISLPFWVAKPSPLGVLLSRLLPRSCDVCCLHQWIFLMPEESNWWSGCGADVRINCQGHIHIFLPGIKSIMGGLLYGGYYVNCQLFYPGGCREREETINSSALTGNHRMLFLRFGFYVSIRDTAEERRGGVETSSLQWCR